MVGTAWTWNLSASSPLLSSSISTLSKCHLPLPSSYFLAITGAIALHGPHHAAEKFSI